MRDIIWQGETLVKEINDWNHPHVRAEVLPLIVYQDSLDPWGKPERHMGFVLQCVANRNAPLRGSREGMGERFLMQQWCTQRGMVTPRIVAWEEETLPFLHRLYDAWDTFPIVCPLVN